MARRATGACATAHTAKTGNRPDTPARSSSAARGTSSRARRASNGGKRDDGTRGGSRGVITSPARLPSHSCSCEGLVRGGAHAQCSHALGVARARGSVMIGKCGRGGGRHSRCAYRVFVANRAALSRPPPRPANWRYPLPPRSRYAERGAGFWSAPSRASWETLDANRVGLRRSRRCATSAPWLAASATAGSTRVRAALECGKSRVRMNLATKIRRNGGMSMHRHSGKHLKTREFVASEAVAGPKAWPPRRSPDPATGARGAKVN